MRCQARPACRCSRCSRTPPSRRRTGSRRRATPPIPWWRPRCPCGARMALRRPLRAAGAQRALPRQQGAGRGGRGARAAAHRRAGRRAGHRAREPARRPQAGAAPAQPRRAGRGGRLPLGPRRPALRLVLGSAAQSARLPGARRRRTTCARSRCCRGAPARRPRGAPRGRCCAGSRSRWRPTATSRTGAARRSRRGRSGSPRPPPPAPAARACCRGARRAGSSTRPSRACAHAT